jgi:hypothetical protein
MPFIKLTALSTSLELWIRVESVEAVTPILHTPGPCAMIMLRDGVWLQLREPVSVVIYELGKAMTAGKS